MRWESLQRKGGERGGGGGAVERESLSLLPGPADGFALLSGRPDQTLETVVGADPQKGTACASRVCAFALHVCYMICLSIVCMCVLSV